MTPTPFDEMWRRAQAQVHVAPSVDADPMLVGMVEPHVQISRRTWSAVEIVLREMADRIAALEGATRPK